MTVSELITDKIINYLKEGKIPWQKPWVGLPPQNFVSKRAYTGINFFLLMMLNFKHPYFLTFNQVKKLGGKIKKGSKSAMIIYWGSFEKKSKDKEEVDIVRFLRYYRVFNVEQCIGLEIPELYKHNKDPKYEEVLDLYKDKPVIKEGNTAFYNPKEDRVSVPSLNGFKTASSYYGVLFHELIHSTGFSTRLHRFTAIDKHIFGSTVYSKEELIAELGSAFLCARYGIDNRLVKNSAGYIQSWLKVLENDPKMIISASSQAQKAVNYMLGEKDDKK